METDETPNNSLWGKPVKVKITADHINGDMTASVIVNGVDLSDRVTVMDYRFGNGAMPTLTLQMFPDMMEIMAKRCRVAVEPDDRVNCCYPNPAGLPVRRIDMSDRTEYERLRAEIAEHSDWCAAVMEDYIKAHAADFAEAVCRTICEGLNPIEFWRSKPDADANK